MNHFLLRLNYRISNDEYKLTLNLHRSKQSGFRSIGLQHLPIEYDSYPCMYLTSNCEMCQCLEMKCGRFCHLSFAAFRT